MGWGGVKNSPAPPSRAASPLHQTLRPHPSFSAGKHLSFPATIDTAGGTTDAPGSAARRPSFKHPPHGFIFHGPGQERPARRRRQRPPAARRPAPGPAPLLHPQPRRPPPQPLPPPARVL